MADIIQVIKYEGGSDDFIWKHPREDFNLGSQLIVHESQEAIFFKDGQALDIFGPGRYTLHTQNIPLIGSVVKLVTNGDSPFHCEVYFVNKTEQIGIQWGTDSQVNYLDPNFNNYPFPVGASGSMNLRVADSRKLLVKVVGTSSHLTRSELALLLKGPMMAKIKSYLPSVLGERKIPIFDIDQHMAEFSEDLKARLIDECADYGVEMVKFWINAFVKPESDITYCKLRDLRGRGLTAVQEAMLQQQLDIIHQQTKSQKIVMEAQAVAEKRKTEGYTFQQERAFDVAERMASNEGSGNFSAAGIGMGMMGGIAGGIGASMTDITASALRPAMQINMSAQPDEKASAQEQPAKTTQQRIEELKLLKGEIPDSLYEQKLQEILASI